MRTVVWVGGKSFTGCAKVLVMTDGALVSYSRDVRLIGLVLAEGSITIDAKVSHHGRTLIRNGSVQSRETVVRVRMLRFLDTSIAVVEIGTVQTFVTDAEDGGITTIAEGVVTDIPTGCQFAGGRSGKRHPLRRRFEAVCGMVTMFVDHVTFDAEVEIITGGTSDELTLGENHHTVVASASGHGRLGIIGEASGHFLGDSSRRDAFGGTVDELSVGDVAFDQPVTLARAKCSRVDALFTEIVITRITDAAMEMGVVHGLIAVVAVNGPSMTTRFRDGFTRAEDESGFWRWCLR
jgi:hypothetical protein